MSMIFRNLLFVCLFCVAGLFCSFRADYLPVPTKNLIEHTYYMLSYNDSCEEANWVYYVLTDSMVLNAGEKRTNNFRMDKLVPSGSAKTSDYTRSGYDRGHLCPAADMGFNQIAMTESFLMSNITPQAPDFNRGIWKKLETEVRNWALLEHKLVIVTGPVFKDNKGTIGADKVVVPGYFFKLIYDASGNPRMIAFLIPNAKTNRPLTDFAVSVDQVEQLTGYNFFSQLPDDVENNLESKIILAGWFKGYPEPEPIVQKTDAPVNSKHTGTYFYLSLVLILAIVILIVYIKGRKNN